MKPILTIRQSEHFSESALASLKVHFEVFQHPGVTNCDVLWTRLGGVELYHYPNLRAIACNMTDVSHLPLEECQRRSIEVLSLKGIEGLDTVHATAEHTISLMLQALRHRADRSSGRIGRELRGKTVFLVGYGRVSHQVEAYLEAFGTRNWIGYHITEAPDELSECDIVSIHASLNDTSRGMVNAEFLSKLKPGCILVNTARHAIVEGKAILDWLYRDNEAIYAHDFRDEWRPEVFDNNTGDDMGLMPHPRIIGTPHIGGWTIESLHKTEELLAERVIEWSKTHAPTPTPVPSIG